MKLNLGTASAIWRLSSTERNVERCSNVFWHSFLPKTNLLFLLIYILPHWCASLIAA